MFTFQSICDSFWNPDVWLPPNVTWSDLQSNDEIHYADHTHLLIPFILAVVFLGLRYVLEKFWFTPIGLSLGIKNTKNKKPVPYPALEKEYSSLGKGRLKHKQILLLAKQVDLKERQVERWLRLRRLQDKPSTLTKFCETSWRWLYYSGTFCYGMAVMWDKAWLWDIQQCYYNYPHHGVTNDIWWYYMTSLGFYWALTFSQFNDVKRKDFWQMFVHHIATIFLLSFSWVCNMHRIGSVILLIHDSADAFLEAAKLAKYAQFQRLCDVLFVVFTVLWVSTRCGLFPFWVIYSTTMDAPKIVPMFPAYYIFNSLLVLLLGLHIFWTYIIVKIAYKAVTSGEMEGDIRSSSSDVSDSAYSGRLSSSSPGSSPKKNT